MARPPHTPLSNPHTDLSRSSRHPLITLICVLFALALLPGCGGSGPTTTVPIAEAKAPLQTQLANIDPAHHVFKDHDAALQAANSYYQALYAGNKDMPAKLTSSNWMTVKEAVVNDASGIDTTELREFFDIWANDAAPAWYRNPWIIGPLVALIGVALVVMVVVGKRKRAQ